MQLLESVVCLLRWLMMGQVFQVCLLLHEQLRGYFLIAFVVLRILFSEPSHLDLKIS